VPLFPKLKLNVSASAETEENAAKAKMQSTSDNRFMDLLKTKGMGIH
jgi:hypothetical protein